MINQKGFIRNLNSIYEEVDIIINPVRFGAGLKIKNIEALGNGLPIGAMLETSAASMEQFWAKVLRGEEMDPLDKFGTPVLILALMAFAIYCAVSAVSMLDSTCEPEQRELLSPRQALIPTSPSAWALTNRPLTRSDITSSPTPPVRPIVWRR